MVRVNLVYAQEKDIFSYIYPSTYGILVQILLPKHVLVHIRDGKDDLILLPYVSTFYSTYVI